MWTSVAYAGDLQQHLDQPTSSWMEPHKRYKIEGELGKGAYGTVFHVRDQMTGREFAMKRILVRRNDEGIPQSLLREISTLKSLQRIAHDNVTKMYDVFASTTSDSGGYDQCINVIYEKCDWDLHDFLKMIPRNLGDGQCRHLARQLFEGLDFLHTHGVIHRDLKPQNILVNRNHTLKIADFGLARTYTMHSSFTTVVVTLWYRSPELLLQCKYNASIDIWSAGCILVELYTRNALFPCQTEVEQLKLIFYKMGTPSPQMWPEDAVVDGSSFPLYAPIPMESLAPPLQHAPNSIDLVLKTLHFIPHLRPSAAECLDHPFFTDFAFQLP